jgi:ABC-type multidrug transport system ATPase subunit
VIELFNLVKTSGKLVAVNDVSLKLATGEFFVLLPKRGGHTTTPLKILAGLTKPTASSAGRWF